MKKNQPLGKLSYNPLKKILLIMRIAAFLMILGILQANAIDAYSQKTRLSLNFTGTELVKVLDQIEQESDFFFLYNEKLLDAERKVNIEAKNQLISSILDDLFSGTNVKYTIIDRKIILAPDYLTEESESLQQQKTVTGTVKDENDNPLPGVNIQIEGTSVGSITDVNGKYSIGIPNENAVLIFSFIGYNTQKIPLDGKSAVDVSLVPTVESLEEVVVVGYGVQKKKDVTSAITVVDAATLKQAPVANVTNALQGMSAGIEVQSNQGRPGEAPTVRIRGVSSTNNTDPLYVVDGIPMDGAYVISSDVESMQVLKDAASCAIYGSRGANGVIIITTKSGKSGAPKVSYNGYYGFETPWKQLDLLSIEQWAQLVTESNEAGGTTPPTLATDIVNNGGRYNGDVTDWQKEIFQTGAIKENTFDVSGGTNSGNYFFSLNQYGQDGIIIDTKYKRYSARMNSNWHTDRFKFGENISFTYSQNEGEDSNGGRSAIEELIKITPNIPVKNPNVLGGYSGYNTAEVGHDASNPVGSMIRATNMFYNKRFIGNVYGEYQIIKDLSFRTTFGLNSIEAQNRNFTLKTDMAPKNYANTTLSENAGWTYNWVWENMATYHKVFGQHDLTAMGAYTSEYSQYHQMTGAGNVIQTETNDILSKTEQGFTVGGAENETSRISYLGRIMYTYMGKYMLTANFRRDGSSKFGPGKKWGNFPSVSLAWRMSEEPFLRNVETLSNLKLRTSYGVVGNDAPVRPYSYVSGLSSGQDYVFNGTKYSGVTVTGFNNPDISWETVKQFDAGIDVGLFKGALEASLDYFDKRTIDMLIDIPLPASSGSSASITQNVGSIMNRGFEFSTTFRKSIGDLNFSVTGNLATVHNEVLDVYEHAITSGTVEFGSATRTEVGHSIGEFYGYKVLGVFPDQSAIDNYTKNEVKIQPNAKPGDIQFADLNDDGIINEKDRYYMGSPIPPLTYSLNANLDFKGFDFSIFFQGVQGNEIYAELVAWTEGMHNNFNAGAAALDRWTPDHIYTSVPRAVRNDPNENIKKISDRYIKSGSYMRLKNASLGYTIPKSAVKLLHVSNLRIYVTGRNLLTFTKYPFYDPEIGSGAIGTGGTANTSRGIDNGYYPQARTFIGGIQLDF
jgi:TonB-linked SusC/RagA family outer membrane protein